MERSRYVKPVLVLAFVAIIILLTRASSAQDDVSECIQLYVDGSLVYESAVCNTSPTATPQPTSTNTSPPTSTDTPTETPEPDNTPTNTPEPVGNGQPDPDDPACETHDDRVWHGLHDAGRDCHYDHAHGMPQPGWVSDVFSQEVADILWTVSYPWQTEDENDTKHAGYVMHAYDFRSEPCVGVDAYAAQTHGVGISHGKLARFHSFALAASLCNEDGDAGWIFTAGHEDYGQLISPYKKNFVSYPGFPEQMYDIGFPPYVGEGDPNSNAQKETWNSVTRRSSRPHVDEHEVAGIAFRIRRAVDFVDPDSRLAGDPVFVPFGNADSNSSAYQMYQVEVSVPDLNGDGSRVTGTFWTDVHGNLRNDCNEPAENCVPLILNNALPGSYSINATAEGYIESTHLPGSYYDHDIYFGGEPSGWIDLSEFGE